MHIKFVSLKDTKDIRTFMFSFLLKVTVFSMPLELQKCWSYTTALEGGVSVTKVFTVFM